MGFKIESALLEACVLSVLSKGDTYGYVLTQSMKQVLDISESTLYPVLRRLQKEELLETYDVGGDGAKPEILPADGTRVWRKTRNISGSGCIFPGR